MNKKLFFATLAITALASCSSNDFVGDESPQGSIGTNGAIGFNTSTSAITRTIQEDGAAATALGNKFIVWGEKNESGGTAATEGNTVFQNYTVEYTASTAYTTLSNTNDWEYVGKTSYGTKLTPNAPASQTIKYWDNGASSYTFTALSALDADITNDKVVITKNTAGTTDEYEKGYTIAVKEGASVGNIFFADRINDTPANLRNSAVKFSFRNLQAKLRFGIYETVPGYTVKIKQVKYNNAYSTANFGVDGKFIKPGDNTSFTVTYGNGTTGPLNKALVAVTADSYDTYLASTSTTIMSATSIGTTSNTATLDDYVSILPYTSNTTDLSFTIDYTLKSEDTNEIIEITGKTVKVPAAYCQWKSNYAYTYLFKITDSDLTPITFDACYVEDENGNQETITTVTEPSITTFGIKGGKYVTGKNEYEVGSDIYATFMEGSAVLTPQLTSNNKANFVKVYAVTYKDGTTDDEKTAHPITELSVANAIEHPGGLITATHINTQDNAYFAAEPAAVTSVPGEDGNNKTVNALKLQGAKAAGKYAVEIVTYTGSVPAIGTSLDGYYSVSDGSYSTASGTADGTSTYYKQVKTYKVITVVAS